MRSHNEIMDTVQSLISELRERCAIVNSSNPKLAARLNTHITQLHGIIVSFEAYNTEAFPVAAPAEMEYVSGNQSESVWLGRIEGKLVMTRAEWLNYGERLMRSRRNGKDVILVKGCDGEITIPRYLLINDGATV